MFDINENTMIEALESHNYMNLFSAFSLFGIDGKPHQQKYQKENNSFYLNLSLYHQISSFYRLQSYVLINRQ